MYRFYRAASPGSYTLGKFRFASTSSFSEALCSSCNLPSCLAEVGPQFGDQPHYAVAEKFTVPRIFVDVGLTIVYNFFAKLMKRRDYFYGKKT